MSEDTIHESFLKSHDWEKSKKEASTFTRGGNVVRYDGVDWYYNGKKLDNSISRNHFLKIPQFRFPFKNNDDYYERMMESK